MSSVLIVDDNPLLAASAEDFFERHSYEVHIRDNAPDALRLIQHEMVPDILFSDIVMPGAYDGFELAKLVRRDFPQVRILLTTGWQLPEYSPFEVLLKPYHLADIMHWIENIAKSGLD